MAARSSNEVVVLRGKGDATFRPKTDYRVGSEPWTMAVGDFNNDGRADIVATHRTAGRANLALLYGRGDGTFETAAPFLVHTGAPFPSPFELAVGDFDRDGWADLAVTDDGAESGGRGINVVLNVPAALRVSGRITQAGGAPLASANVTLSGAQQGVTQTDASGDYSFIIRQPAGAYTVTPSKTNYDFTPPSATLNDPQGDQTVDFTAALQTPTLAGKITDANGTPVAGAKVDLAGSKTDSKLTDGNGQYAFTGLTLGSSYTVTPSLNHLTFAPATRAFNNLSASNLAANFTGARLKYAVGGRVLDVNGAAMAGVGVTLTGVYPEGFVNTSATTDSNGDYSFGQQPAGGNYVLTPSMQGATFAPPSAGITDLDQNRSIGFVGTQPDSVGFQQAEYAAAEGSGAVELTVARAGDLSQGATVLYETVSQTASDRSDLTSAIGRLRFAPGEATKKITVFITDDRYDEPAESFAVLLSSPEGVELASRYAATVTVTDNDEADGPSPVSDAAFDAQFFVRHHYLDFFGREADQAGLDFWAGQIAECESRPEAERQGCREGRRQNVSAAFFLSIEFQETGFLVYRLNHAAYATAERLSRRDFLADSHALGEGVVVGQEGWQQRLEQNKQALADEFVARTEFRALYPETLTAAQFVDALDANAGRVLSTQERDALVSDLASGAKTRAQVLRAVAEDADLLAAHKSRAFVLMQYLGYLRRAPDRLGFDFWLGKLDEFHGDYIAAEMVKAFITSAEYVERFGRP